MSAIEVVGLVLVIGIVAAILLWPYASATEPCIMCARPLHRTRLQRTLFHGPPPPFCRGGERRRCRVLFERRIGLRR